MNFNILSKELSKNGFVVIKNFFSNMLIKNILRISNDMINLPETTSEPLPRKKSDPLIISIQNDGVIYLETQSTLNLPLDLEMLSEKVSKIIKANPSLQVVVRGDGNVRYQKVMELMSTLQASGVKDVGLITKAPIQVQD